ncbi:S-adenosyl-L-methionine-dependent methyltransferases superfamily protein isoform 1 [Tripterygium wilfordii]|uniref:Methyltransferase n=1 Tax=Tripterygium wilfordii TaxID=458696 RepID=A0A7J7DDB7_TRIWF|nr:S-adenosyl-L-methionine-dependent methyltransferases superfamily protein isoform 1 [Tripterygium wilfordii]
MKNPSLELPNLNRINIGGTGLLLAIAIKSRVKVKMHTLKGEDHNICCDGRGGARFVMGRKRDFVSLSRGPNKALSVSCDDRRNDDPQAEGKRETEEADAIKPPTGLGIELFEVAINQTSSPTTFDKKMSSLDVARAELALAVLYLNKAEARDKICRAIQYGSKFLSNGKPGTAQNVDKSTSLARKVFRLFKFVNDLHALISPVPQGTPLPLVLLGKSKNSLLSTFLFLDQIVWLGRSGIYKNKERAEFLGRISLFCWMGSSICTTLVEVASWGAYLLSRNILTMSFAPRDTHEAQVQFALERGVPALIGVLASIRLPYPSRAFDMAHCSRCLIPWGQYDGLYLIEVDRILRPGGYWILSGPPINWERYWKGWGRSKEDLQAEQNKIESIAKSLCWKKLKQKGDLAIWQKPTNHIHCKANRRVFKQPSFCNPKNPDNGWYTKMEKCLTPLPEVSNIREIAGGQLAKWPERSTSIPPRISSGSLGGITAEIFRENTELWKKRVAYYKTLDNQLAERGRYRNLLDMNANLGGFAAALVDDPVWVMNVVPVEAEINTLGVIYERGLIGTYQNWCEAMSTYPRTYDFIHADFVFTLYEGRCEMEDIVLEMDRILRPEGSVIIRDDVDVLTKMKNIIDVMQWDGRIMDHEKGPHEREKILVAGKQYWTSPAPKQNQ